MAFKRLKKAASFVGDVLAGGNVSGQVYGSPNIPKNRAKNRPQVTASRPTPSTSVFESMFSGVEKTRADIRSAGDARNAADAEKAAKAKTFMANVEAHGEKVRNSPEYKAEQDRKFKEANYQPPDSEKYAYRSEKWGWY